MESKVEFIVPLPYTYTWEMGQYLTICLFKSKYFIK